MSSKGERVRMREQVKILRGLLEGFESTFEAELPCSSSAQSVADTAVRIVSAAGRCDAYQRAEVSIADFQRSTQIHMEERDKLAAELDATKQCPEAIILRRALRAALATWCPHDPKGDGADGDTYRMAHAALQGKDGR
jgi:hypothetical protein